jgi:hypothetical protein
MLSPYFCRGGGRVEGQRMLTIRQLGTDRSTFLDRWEAHALLRDDVEFGRMEICAPGMHPNTGLVTIQDDHYECRIHFTAKRGLRFVPGRWVMYAGETELHAARHEEFGTFLIDNVPGSGSLRLRRNGLLRTGLTIDRMPDEKRIGDVRFLRGRILPRRAPQYLLEVQGLPVTLEIFLAWIVVQNGYEAGS